MTEMSEKYLNKLVVKMPTFYNLRNMKKVKRGTKVIKRILCECIHIEWRTLWTNYIRLPIMCRNFLSEKNKKHSQRGVIRQNGVAKCLEWWLQLLGDIVSKGNQHYNVIPYDILLGGLSSTLVKLEHKIWNTLKLVMKQVVWWNKK